MTNRNQGTENRGFASMDKEKQREISAKGGHASQGGGNSRSNQSQGKEGGGTRGGSSEQHARAGRQSHKNS
jgi:uncharacterized protein